MNKSGIQLIEEEIAQAGESSPITPLLLELDRLRITGDTPVPCEEFLMRLFDKPCFPRRDLTAITGMEKCGKTFFTSMLMASGVSSSVAAPGVTLSRLPDKPLRILWYDTEQSRQSTKTILTDRIYELAGKGQAVQNVSNDTAELDGRLFVFNVRSCTYEQRLEYLITAIMTYRPDMVVIDNISDLLSSINDQEQSIMLIDQLMQLSTTYDCNITIVIHLNRSGEKRNLRGWLGTEVLHKAFEVYYCEQLPKEQVFAVEQLLTRKYHIKETFYYRISDDGLPVTTECPDVQPRDAQGKYMSNKPEAYQIRAERADSFNQDYIIRHEDDSRMPWEWDLRRLFDNAMASRAQMNQADLQAAVMQLSGIQQPKYYDKVFRLACDNHIVKTTMDRNGRVVVISTPS